MNFKILAYFKKEHLDITAF